MAAIVATISAGAMLLVPGIVKPAMADTPPAKPASGAQIEDSPAAAGDAKITKLDIVSQKTGTAPFDTSDNPGSDSSADNNIVRSFDRVSYTLEATSASKDTNVYYKNARIGFSLTLREPASKAKLDTDDLGWADQTKGYQPIVTTNADGSQTLTAYRLLTPTKESPTNVPGTTAVNFYIDVRDMVQGQTFTPTFGAWVVPSTKPDQSINGDKITVSSKPQFNVALNDKMGGNAVTFDWSKGTGKYPSDTLNSNLGKMRGMPSSFQWGLEMMSANHADGIKGTEYPKAGMPITINVDASARVKDSSGNVLSTAKQWQPYFYVLKSGDNMQNSERVLNRERAWSSLWGGGYPELNRYAGARNNVYNSGDTKVDQVRSNGATNLTFTVQNWSVNYDQFPVFMGDDMYNHEGRKCSPYLMSDGCKAYRRAVVSSNIVTFQSPIMQNGRSLVQMYGKQVQVETVFKTAGMKVIGESGQTATVQADNTDDNIDLTYPVTASARFAKTIYFMNPDNPVHWNGMDNTGSFGIDINKGSDKALPGGRVRIQLGSDFTSSTDSAVAPVFNVQLFKFDDKVLQFTGNLDPNEFNDGVKNPQGRWWTNISGNVYQEGNSGTLTFYYAVRKNGKGWGSDAQQDAASFDDFNYYKTLSEAQQHGVVTGALLVSRDVSPVESVNEWDAPSFVMQVRRDAKVGTTGEITSEAFSYTRQHLVDTGIVPASLTVDSPQADWLAWAKTINPVQIRKEYVPNYADKSGQYYKKSTYTGNTYNPGTEGREYGDTIYVAGEVDSLSDPTTAQANAQGKEGKTVYDLDKDERNVDYDIPFSMTSRLPHETTVTMKVTLPAGLTFIKGSEHLDGTYSEHTPDAGTVAGGSTPVIASVSKGSDGTTYTFRMPNVSTDGKTHHLHLSASIGNPFDPDVDSKNNEKYKMTATISSTYDQQISLIGNHRMKTVTFSVSKTHAAEVASRIDPFISETNDKVTVTNMAANIFDTSVYGAVYLEQVPANGQGLSSYHGALTLTGGKITRYGANGTIRVRFATNPKYRTMKPADFTPAMAWGSDFRNATLSSDGTVILPYGMDGKAVTAATVIVSNFPARSRFTLALDFARSGAHAGDALQNRWSYKDSTAPAISLVADRVVSGTVWKDSNKNGRRDTGETGISGLRVRIVKGGATVNLTDGEPASTLTAADGTYRFDGVPAGSGYSVEVTPAAGGSWGFKVSPKQAKDVPADLNSDADALSGNKGATISLATLPATSAMNSARYVDASEDVGLISNVQIQDLPSAGGVPVLYILLLTGITGVALMLAPRRKRVLHKA